MAAGMAILPGLLFGKPLPLPCELQPLAPFCNASLSDEARVADLLVRLSAADKRNLIGRNSNSALLAGALPPYEWWSEALHGVASSPGVRFGGALPAATSFPQVLAPLRAE
jgi:hypothetical protein